MANAETRTGVAPLVVALAGALSLAVAMGIGRFAFTPMLPLMIGAGQLDVASGGWLASANYAGYLLGALTASRVPLSPGRLGAAALVLTAALTAAMALPVSPWLWAALRLAAGICSAWAFVATSVWCLGALARAQRPSWSGGVYAGVGAGIAIAGLYCLAGGSANASPMSLWLQLGLLALVLMAPVLWVLGKLNNLSQPAAASVVRAAAVPPRTTGLVICYGVLGFGYILPATFLPVLARSVVEDPRLFGLAWPVFGLMAALSTFMAAWCMRHASRLQVWAIAHVLMGAGVLLPSLWPNGWTIALSALLVGGTFMVITMAGVQEIRARAVGDPTALVGRMTAAFALGQIAGPVASSLLLHLPDGSANGLNLALQAGGASLLVSAAWLWREAHTSQRLQEVPHAP
ncbi:YbfB/YjiJ family MFS transporter [Ramlibacter sp. WS9]|uniref:YbfB/YjiJ family MFS transporter n=1 Tax=Ramlibacter sp. WS9 TaxID=1882741 RepID=UPI00114374D0|nr:YbfB/YjiJ family MFS transporter [Ramlibacter sp. WS9]ROZ62943.1 YbfB/YjiJ family MFS transporter [Ramlibacter sp. WS9]